MDWKLECAVVVLMCGVAAVTDTRTGLIPNWLTLPVIVGAPLVHACCAGLGALLQSLLAVVLCGLVPYVMFRAGGMGGGDVKLFAAVGAVAGLGFGLQVLGTSLSIASVWGIGLLVYRGQLLATIDRLLRLVFGRWWPRRKGETEGTPLQIRLGPAVVVAAIGVMCVEAIGTDLAMWLP